MVTTSSPESLHFTLPAVVVHQALRREFRLAGPLVSRVPVGDAERARVVSRHLDFLLRGLRHHHELEDDQIWPLLHARLPVGARRTIVTMHDQHRHIDLLVERINQLMAAWPTKPAAVAAFRGPLADQLETLHELLTVHLDMEERIALPLAEEHLTEAEWTEIGRLAEASNPRNERALTFGMLQYEGDPHVLASMLASAPPPVRLLLPHLARRAYRRHAIAIHGTPTP
jgi:iron-sulfur cluster repair protein YtfE (RIC family)